MTFYHITTANNIRIITHCGIRPQIRKNKTQNAAYFFPDMTTAENALNNWLNEQYDKKEKLYVLRINLPDNFEINTNSNYEISSTELIRPEYITAIYDRKFRCLSRYQRPIPVEVLA